MSARQRRKGKAMIKRLLDSKHGMDIMGAVLGFGPLVYLYFFTSIG